MKLSNLIIPTPVAKAGTPMADVFRECVELQLSGLPFMDADGRISGRISLRNTLKLTCIPTYVSNYAHMLGDDDLSCLTDPEAHAAHVMQMPAEEVVLEKIVSINSGATVVKALGMMEEYNTSYLFVIDDGEYKGVITRMGIAKRMLEVSGCI